MDYLLTLPEGLMAAGGATGGQAVTVAAGSAAVAPPTTAVVPGTLSPSMIAATAYVNAHGASRLAASTLGAAVVASIAEAYAENGIGYTITDAGNAVSLTA